MCFDKFWEPVPYWVVPGQEEGRCGGEDRTTTQAGREGDPDRTLGADLAYFWPSFRLNPPLLSAGGL